MKNLFKALIGICLFPVILLLDLAGGQHGKKKK